MAKQKNTIIYLVAALLFLGGVGYLVYSGLSESSVYFLNVSEAQAADQGTLKNVRLFGTVSPKDLKRSDSPRQLSFLLEDKDDKSKTMAVEYGGTVPDTFKEGVEVIVEGGMSGSVFKAKTLITKCPSKYQKQKRS